MDTMYNKRHRDDPIHQLKNLVAGQCFQLRKEGAIYMRLTNDSFTPANSQVWARNRDRKKWALSDHTRVLEVRVDEVACVTLSYARLFAFPGDREIIPVYCTVVLEI